MGPPAEAYIDVTLYSDVTLLKLFLVIGASAKLAQSRKFQEWCVFNSVKEKEKNKEKTKQAVKTTPHIN